MCLCVDILTVVARDSIVVIGKTFQSKPRKVDLKLYDNAHSDTTSKIDMSILENELLD